jgi:hypothetical protein
MDLAHTRLSAVLALDDGDVECQLCYLREWMRRETVGYQRADGDAQRLLVAPSGDQLRATSGGLEYEYEPGSWARLTSHEAAWQAGQAARRARTDAEHIRLEAEHIRMAEIEAERWGTLSLEQRLNECNSTRRLRVLDADDVASAVRTVASWQAGDTGRVLHLRPRGCVWSAAYRHESAATIAVAVRVPRGVVVDVALTGGRGGIPQVWWQARSAETPAPSADVRKRTLLWAAATQRLRYGLATARRLGLETV